MIVLLRIVCAILLIEITNLARARSAVGAFLPDPAVAVVCIIALLGRREIIFASAAAMALLRIPATLCDPVAASGALLAIAWMIRGTRHFVGRERPAVIFIISLAAALFFASIARAAARARGDDELSPWITLASCASNAAFSVILAPALRVIPFTKGLFDRRFGE